MIVTTTLYVALFFAAGCLLNCIFYLAARLVNALHIASKRAMASLWWMIGAWSWFFLGQLIILR